MDIEASKNSRVAELKSLGLIRLGWIGVDWRTGLDWIRLDWTRLDKIRFDSIRFNSITLDQITSNSIQLDVDWLDYIGSNQVRLY